MPTLKPRLTITITDDLACQLRELSRLTGNSQSALIADLLAGSWPVFDRMIEVLRAAETAKMAMHGHLANSMGETQDQIDEKLGIVRQEVAQRPVERDARRILEATPLSNRGVRSGRKQANGGLK